MEIKIWQLPNIRAGKKTTLNNLNGHFSRSIKFHHHHPLCLCVSLSLCLSDAEEPWDVLINTVCFVLITIIMIIVRKGCVVLALKSSVTQQWIGHTCTETELSGDYWLCSPSVKKIITTRRELQTWKGISFHLALQIGHTWLPWLTFDEMQWKWKVWEHSAVKRAWPCPAFMLPRQIAHVLWHEQINVHVSEQKWKSI